MLTPTKVYMVKRVLSAMPKLTNTIRQCVSRRYCLENIISTTDSEDQDLEITICIENLNLAKLKEKLFTDYKEELLEALNDIDNQADGVLPEVQLLKYKW